MNRTAVLLFVAVLLASCGGSPSAVVPAPTATPLPLTGRIAFVSYRDGNAEIYVMNADGSGQTRISYGSTEVGQPAWSPDGRRIAFTSDRDGNLDIYVMNAVPPEGGTGRSGWTRLTDNPARDMRPA